MAKTKMTYEEFMEKYPITKLKSLEKDQIDDFCRSVLYYVKDGGGKINALPISDCGFWKPTKPKEKATETQPKSRSYKIKTDGTYAWQDALGDNVDAASEEIKKQIYKIAECAQNKNYSEIDNILPTIADSFKWKIAYFYSGKDLLDWFKKDDLIKFANELLNDKNFDEKSNISEIQQMLIKIRNEKYDGSNEKFYQECLSEIYSGIKNSKDKTMTDTNNNSSDLTTQCKELLEKTKNIILHGAPGTGKTYLAKQIAQQMIFGNVKQELSDEEKKTFNEQVELVQFHPSYDYTDFVEGLRPVNDGGQIGFERCNGVFKEFCSDAIENIETFQDFQKQKNDKDTVDVLELFSQYCLYVEKQIIESDERFIPFYNSMKIRKICKNRQGQVRSIEIATSVDTPKKQTLSVNIFYRDYLKFKNGEIKDADDVKPKFESQSTRHGNAPSSREESAFVKLLLDSEKLVVFRDSFASAKASRLDLACVYSDCKVCNECIFTLAASVADDCRVTRSVCKFDRVKRFGECSDLVEFDKDCVCNASFNALAESVSVRYEKVVADDLDLVAQFFGHQRPAFPVVFCHTVFDREDRVFRNEVFVVFDHFDSGF